MQFNGKLAMQRENNATVKDQTDDHCSSCYQRPSREAEGCWGGVEGSASFIGGRRRSGRCRRAVTLPRDGRRRRRNSVGDFGVDRRARASREHSGSTVVLLEAPWTSGDDRSVLLLTGAAWTPIDEVQDFDDVWEALVNNFGSSVAITETAAIVAVSIIQYAFGDLGE